MSYNPNAARPHTMASSDDRKRKSSLGRSASSVYHLVNPSGNGGGQNASAVPQKPLGFRISSPGGGASPSASRTLKKRPLIISPTNPQSSELLQNASGTPVGSSAFGAKQAALGDNSNSEVQNRSPSGNVYNVGAGRSGAYGEARSYASLAGMKGPAGTASSGNLLGTHNAVSGNSNSSSGVSSRSSRISFPVISQTNSADRNNIVCQNNVNGVNSSGNQGNPPGAASGNPRSPAQFSSPIVSSFAEAIANGSFSNANSFGNLGNGLPNHASVVNSSGNVPVHPAYTGGVGGGIIKGSSKRASQLNAWHLNSNYNSPGLKSTVGDLVMSHSSSSQKLLNDEIFVKSVNNSPVRSTKAGSPTRLSSSSSQKLSISKQELTKIVEAQLQVMTAGPSSSHAASHGVKDVNSSTSVGPDSLDQANMKVQSDTMQKIFNDPNAGGNTANPETRRAGDSVMLENRSTDDGGTIGGTLTSTSKEGNTSAVTSECEGPMVNKSRARGANEAKTTARPLTRSPSGRDRVLHSNPNRAPHPSTSVTQRSSIASAADNEQEVAAAMSAAESIIAFIGSNPTTSSSTAVKGSFLYGSAQPVGIAALNSIPNTSVGASPAIGASGGALTGRWADALSSAGEAIDKSINVFNTKNTVDKTGSTGAPTRRPQFHNPDIDTDIERVLDILGDLHKTDSPEKSARGIDIESKNHLKVAGHFSSLSGNHETTQARIQA